MITFQVFYVKQYFCQDHHTVTNIKINYIKLKIWTFLSKDKFPHKDLSGISENSLTQKTCNPYSQSMFTYCFPSSRTPVTLKVT